MSDPSDGTDNRYRTLAWFARVFVAFHWWAVPLIPGEWTEKWLWSLEPVRWFPLWFRVLFPSIVIVVPWERFLRYVQTRYFNRVPDYLLIPSIAIGGGCVFWFLRIGRLELGDARLLMDHFTALTTYASVREPLESILHTEFARFLFFEWGVHPETGFKIQSCLIGAATLGLGAWALSSWPEKRYSPALVLLSFLVGPVYLFFGYIEWYTQLAAGLILFQIFGLRTLLTGKGLGWALACFIFAGCSHLIGFTFLPAAFALIALVRKGGDTYRTSMKFALAVSAALAATLVCLSFRIRFDVSVENTRTLFSFLLPVMREDNPANPPGSWNYPWLSGNHLGDLANEMLLCGLFPILLWVGSRKGREEATAPERKELKRSLVFFYGAQLVPCALFFSIWNPWLGFPSDWDLFSFFAWPFLAAGLVYCWNGTRCGRRGSLLVWAAVPAFSVVFAWAVGYHRGHLPDPREVFASKDRAYYDRLLEEARSDRINREWKEAFAKVEKILRESPDRVAECFAVFDFPAIQKMSEEWAILDQVTPLAVDFEIVSASPQTRLLVLDVWGRVFFWEGGYFNDWCPMGLSGVPQEKAVDMEIAPWIPAGVILTDRGDLYRFPIPSWVDPDPPGESPRLTYTLEGPTDRFPTRMGNFYEDFADRPLGRGQRAVDLVVDVENERFVVLDTTGDLKGEGAVAEFEVDPLAALIRIDAELDPRTDRCYTVDHFSTVNLWPGREPPMKPAEEFVWPAVTDFEVGFAGADLYILEGQGGIVTVSEFGDPRIKSERLRHYLPTGQPVSITPYITEPSAYFIDLELVPGERTFYKMTKNFRIHYSEMREDSTPP